jgi:glutaminase
MDEAVLTESFVSTGRLPPERRVTELVDEALALYMSSMEGRVSQAYPALARVSPDLFGICVASTGGEVYAAGDADIAFPIMSVSKPFVFALVGDEIGFDLLRRKIGVNATGQAFNSLAAVDNSRDGRTNPMVNSGAINTTSLVPGETFEEKWRFIQDGLSRFAGRVLALNEQVYDSAKQTNHRNRAIAHFLYSADRMAMDPSQATDLYTRQCCLDLTAQDLSLMGATLAGGGVHPISRTRVVSAEACIYTLAVMLTAGLYETSGDWLYDVGLPGKSGIGGGIVTVSPGKGGLATFAPRLDEAGNSVKGQLVARHLSLRLGLSLLISRASV